ncbi:general transcription factor 3C polypeptide 3 [Tetranychus urticae]|uniref:General transcription factor 3C polypeptide 3 n=1 Tax=Tetranychus urticae TaxID=32264 RepID=T1KZ23_TETUR|nr:general transcription factor 3C polypeptide 3 [Tetranychus urticae]
MESDGNASELLNNLMKEVTEKQWETFKKSWRTNNLVISEVMSEGSEESDNEDNVYSLDNFQIAENMESDEANEIIDPRITIDDELSTVRYLDNQISFDELTDVMEKRDFQRKFNTPVQLHQEDIESDDQQSDPEWFSDNQSKRKGRRKDTGRKGARRSKLPRDLSGLVGEANLAFARGSHQDAIAMCSEVIRQAPTAPEPFLTLGMLYEEMGQIEKAFQYNLIAAYLCPSDGEHWIKVAYMAIEQENYSQAIKCLNKAIKVFPGNFDIRLQRCQLFEKIGDFKKALDAYTSLLGELKDGKDAMELAKEIAKIYFNNEDINSSLKVMESTFAKFEKFVTGEGVNLYLELLIFKKKYLKTLEIFQKFCGIRLEIEDEELTNFDPDNWSKICPAKVEIKLTFEMPVDLQAKLVVCLINLGCMLSVKNLIRGITIGSAEKMSDLYLDIADAYAGVELHKEAEPLLAALIVSKARHNSQVWLKYARCLRQLEKFDESIRAYREVVRSCPDDHEAKLELTDLLIRVGRPQDATNVSDQDNSAIVNLELLKLRCDLLYRQEMWKDFVHAAKLLLSNEMEFVDTERELMILATSSSLARRLENLRDVQKEMGITNRRESDLDFVGKGLDFKDFINIYLKLCRVILEKLNEKEELVRIALSTYSSAFSEGEYLKHIDYYALMALFEVRDEKFSYSLAKNALSRDIRNKQIWNIFGATINLVYQDLRHNRFCLRHFIKFPDITALAYFNGHNALISGSYKHALGEYVNIHKENPKDPFAILCIAIGFLHLACQKFTSNRHSAFNQMCAFLNLYLEARGECQESLYNIGRAFHQLGLFNEAVHFYERALNCISEIDSDSDVDKARFNLNREISFNLSLIYRNSGSPALARRYLIKYFVV